MSKIYYHLIKTYIKESKKLISERMTRTHLIVPQSETPEDSQKTFQMAKKLITNINSQIRTMTEGAHSSKETVITDPFVVEDRIHIIESLEQQPQVSRIA